jgi:eukaryotic-like serine/threonine-protein kinase
MVREDENDNAPTDVELRGPPTLGASEADALGLGPTIALGTLEGDSDLAEGTPRYGAQTLIAEGGMGEVHLCRDQRVGRDVAMKVVHPRHRARRDLEVRFLREARVQGQLEHPAIVPVYDIGRDAAGNLYFTMKRVLGTTLEDVIVKLRANDPETRRQYPRHRLLAAFASLCQAVHYAHVRGVVHRDLKPSNVALGGFGEVYVLDWGLAKINEDRLDAPQMGREQAEIDGAGKTEAGVVLGTPGYMAPEQARGGAVDVRTDVFA